MILYKMIKYCNYNINLIKTLKSFSQLNGERRVFNMLFPI